MTRDMGVEEFAEYLDIPGAPLADDARRKSLGRDLDFGDRK